MVVNNNDNNNKMIIVNNFLYNLKKQRMALKHMNMNTKMLFVVTLFTLLQIVSSSSSSTPVSASTSTSTTSTASTASSILVAGSSNLDTFLPLKRLPTPGENLTLLPNTKPIIDVPGGKGCNQAIACSKLSSHAHDHVHDLTNTQNKNVFFLSRLGDVKIDKATKKLINVLKKNNVNIRYCQQCTDLDSGRGYVFLEKDTGKVSAVVSGGSNLHGWDTNDNDDDDDKSCSWVEIDSSKSKPVFTQKQMIFLNTLFQSTQPRCLLLQREIPENVNSILAKYVTHVHNKNTNANINTKTIVLQDIGGEDRPMTKEMLSLCDYVMPNESELLRLVRTFITEKEYNALIHTNHDELQNEYFDDCEYVYEHDENKHDDKQKKDNKEPETSQEQAKAEGHTSFIIKLAKILQANGANHVLVTLGDKGSILIQKEESKKKCTSTSKAAIHYQKACVLKNDHTIVDETGAGDCYRAGFAVALSEGKDVDECMEFASAAGALAVTKEGAVPSIPSRKDVEELLQWNNKSLNKSGFSSSDDDAAAADMKRCNVPRGGASESSLSSSLEKKDDSFPYMFGSRLNSMKDRPELWSNPVDNVREWVKRQGTIEGLGCVDFNWPQHFHSWDAKEAKAALEEADLVAGAVCLRYPSKFARGAMIHPDAKLRREAIDLTKQAAEVARELGCNEVVVWSAYDGYDYPFQVNYKEKWNQIVEAFQECCDAYPDIKWSLEYKPTDENTRFFTVPSTGAAMLLLNDIDRPNMGLTLDVGHMLMAGENPGQSIAMVGDKLFGIQLNDGYTRLAAEDGMMFGSIHPTMALEIMYQLKENNFRGHLYFDTFPQRTDPIKECEYNIKRVKEFWKAAKLMDGKGIKGIMSEHDAVGALNAVNDVMKTV